MPNKCIRRCEHCGREYIPGPGDRGRFCSLPCYGQWLSVHRRGADHPKTGKKYPFKARRAHVTLTCPVCGKTLDLTVAKAAGRRCCSVTCMAIWQATHDLTRGPNNGNWRGGYRRSYGPSWRPAVRAARQRDRICQRCGKGPEELGKALDVHHIKPFRAFGLLRHAEANDVGNLICYCAACHLQVEWETNGRAMLNGELWTSHLPVTPENRPKWVGPRVPPEHLHRGETHHDAKLLEVDIREIRRLYAAKAMTQVALAAHYRVAQAHISAIVLRKTWKHVV